MKLKICGMKYNPLEVASLRPDYLGFIFWEPSSRYFDGEIPFISPSIKKIGVFVDASIVYITETVKKYGLNGVQLHGKESPSYCKSLKEKELGSDVEIIKVFSIKKDFDFSILKEYEKVSDYFLFDTKGKLPGGNGYTFDWAVLKAYPSTKPYFLSGGIGLDNMSDIKEFLKSPKAKYCYAVDVNSKFEDKPGLKKIEKLEEFKKVLGT